MALLHSRHRPCWVFVEPAYCPAPERWDTYEGPWSKRWDNIGIIVSACLHLLLVTAFMFLSLALVAYAGTVGWVAVALDSLAGLFVVGLSIYQGRYVMHQ